tara:strand:+ start:426 stop:746 length:321 start_codon:yes stop_codon:yes gene_type:complete
MTFKLIKELNKMINSMLSFLLRLIPAQEVHAHSGGGGAKKRGAGGAGGSSKEKIKKLETRIKRQETFIKRMSPSKYSRKEVQQEKDQLKTWRSQLSGLKSTTRKKK